MKPANFILVQGQVKLIDFGIANAIANDTTNIQRDHQVGTVNYMSPEAIELPEGMRRLKVGRASDVWSLGIILYQMIYGHPPFSKLGMHAKLAAIVDPHYEVPFPSSVLSVPHRTVVVDERAIDAIRVCLCHEPKQRWTIPQLMAHSFFVSKSRK